jgi:Holliday junction resolvase RusA-like endonuclease
MIPDVKEKEEIWNIVSNIQESVTPDELKQADAFADKQLAPIEGKCKVTYTIFYPNQRKFDIDNIGAIVAKFNNDALTELGILEDDNYEFIQEIVFKFGGIDKDNPRCDVELEELKDDN